MSARSEVIVGSPPLNEPALGLTEYRDQLVQHMNRLPFHHPDRAHLADCIRQVETAIDRAPLEGSTPCRR